MHPQEEGLPITRCAVLPLLFVGTAFLIMHLAASAALGRPGAAPLRVSSVASPASQADALLGIPYRPDGVRDERGRYTLFENPQQEFATPGLNCSGLVYTLWRALDLKAPGVSQAGRDRLGDSGPGAHGGRDWDYGFDLVLNLSEGLARRWLLPQAQAVSASDSGAMRGFPLDDDAAWETALAQVGAGHVCLVSLSRKGKGGKAGQHYHVGLILPGPSGQRYFYQATPKRGVYRLDLGNRQVRQDFAARFGGGAVGALLLDVSLP